MSRPDAPASERKHGLVGDLFAHEVGQRRLGGRDQIVRLVRIGLEQVLRELRQLTCAEHGVLADQEGRADLDIAVRLRLVVQHELAERAFEPGEVAFQHHETRARHARGRLEVHHAEGGAEIDVVLGRGVEPPGRDRRAVGPARSLDVAGLVHAGRDVVGRQVGQPRQDVLEPGAGAALGLILGVDLAFKSLDLGHQDPGKRLVLLGLGLADLLGELVTPGLRRLEGGLRRAEFGVETQDFLQLFGRILDPA